MAKKENKPAATPAAGGMVTVRCMRPGGLAFGGATPAAPGVAATPGLELVVGENQVSMATLQTLRGPALERLKWYEQQGLVAFGPAPAEPAPAAPPPPAPEPGAFSPLPADDAAALAMIKASTSQAELNAWFNLTAANRPALSDALFARLTELDGQ